MKNCKNVIPVSSSFSSFEFESLFWLKSLNNSLNIITPIKSKTLIKIYNINAKIILHKFALIIVINKGYILFFLFSLFLSKYAQYLLFHFSSTSLKILSDL